MYQKILVFLLMAVPLFALTDEEIREAYYKSYNYEKIGDYRNAMNALSPVLKEYPKAYTVNLRMGWLYYLNENYADALKHYEASMKVAPAATEARLGQNRRASLSFVPGNDEFWRLHT